MSGPHFCYILYNQIDNKTYNGYTNNPIRRLRQHNSQIKGGARMTTRESTKYGTNHWDFLVLIKCDEKMTRREALSLEWHIRYPTNRRPRPKQYCCPLGRIQAIHLSLANPKFSGYTFSIGVVDRFLLELQKNVPQCILMKELKNFLVYINQDKDTVDDETGESEEE